mmetsp:Transcript_36200/g.92454  ORF Transcript_36200/g.92454 Transcript_36200/m.92454 type:complete len:305 (+) Transcript_36200:283-1197(+)
MSHFSCEAGEFKPVGPVIHHVVPKPQIGERCNALAPGEASLLHLFVPFAVVARQRVLPCHEAPLLGSLELDSLHKVCWPAPRPLGDLAVGHLQAREVEHYAMPGKHLSNRAVAVAVHRPVVPRRDLCGVAVGGRLPMDPRNLCSEDDVCRLEDSHRVLEHLLPVANEGRRVPLEEEVRLRGFPHATIAEEVRVLGGPAVDSHIVRVGGPHQAQVGLAALDRRLDQILSHVPVVALKLSQAREGPVLERVRWVAHLPRGAEPNLCFDDHVRNEVQVPVCKGLHQVPIHLEGRPPKEDPRVVRPEG